MDEVADILSSEQQIAVLPDLSAGCSMTDMANLSKVTRAWQELSEVLDTDEMVTPVTYINSAADLKAFAVNMAALCVPQAMPPRFFNGLLHNAKRYYFSPINILDAGADIN